MSAPATPQKIATALAAAIAAGDVEAALELWDDDARVIARDGTELRGREAIANMLAGLVNAGATLETELHTLYEAAATAVATGALTIRGTGVDGNGFSARSESLVVYARASDGGWRVAIDFPWGMPDSPVDASPGGDLRGGDRHGGNPHGGDRGGGDQHEGARSEGGDPYGGDRGDADSNGKGS